MILDSRKTAILNTLLSWEGYVTGEALSAAAQAAVRTIRTNIHDLSETLSRIGIPLRSMPGLGYSIAPEYRDAVRRWMNEDCEIHPASPAERRLYFIGNLLDGPLDMGNLPPGFSHSPSTREKDLERLRGWFSGLGLTIYRRGEILTLEGKDEAIRDAYAVYLAELSERTGQALCSLLEGTFPEYGTAAKAVEDFLAESGIALEDEAFERILIHLLSCLRHPPRHIEENSASDAEEIIERLAGFLSAFAEHDPRDLAGELVRRYPGFFVVEISGDCRSRVARALEALPAESPFVVDEALRTGLERICTEGAGEAEAFRSPSISPGDLERRYPRAFRTALEFSALVDGNAPQKPDAGRLVRFGLCFAANLERHRLPERRLRIAVVCASGIGSSQLLSAKLRRFSDSAEILGVFPRHSLSEAERLDPDLIVSTVPVDTAVPAFLIPDFLDDGRFEELAARISRTEGGASLLAEVMTEDLFLGELEVDSAEGAIEIMGRRLVEAGKAAPGFADRVKQREEISPTSIGNGLAVPHAVPAPGGENAICTALLRHPVRWGSESVHTVFLLCLDGSDPAHRGIFRELYALLSNKENMKRFRRDRDFGTLFPERQSK